MTNAANGSDSQKWKLEGDCIVNLMNGKFLDISQVDEVVIMWTKNDKDWQNWEIESKEYILSTTGPVLLYLLPTLI